MEDQNKMSEEGITETPYLIVGAGPAGAALACFLASYGLTGVVVANAPGTSKEPRAHITNPAALECLRDIGLEEECKNNATSGEHMTHTRWTGGMVTEEWGRIHSWGNQPDRKGEYEAASPCYHVDLPQTLLEPILVKHAINKGWKIRFDTTYVEFQRDSPESPIISTVLDAITGTKYRIRSKYVFGCDGARSQVIRQLDIPMLKEPGQGLAINVLAECDLSRYMKNRTGNLHWVFTPEIEYPGWGWGGILRMVKPWHEWMFILLPHPSFDDSQFKPTDEEYLKRCHELIGDPNIPIKLIEVSKWQINEIVAERYSDGNIFCLGDSVHRHPPFNGLGSNTCVQDAFNLAWKVALVERGVAGRALLETFSQERQPIGEGVIRRANQGLRDHIHVWEALGVLPTDINERRKQHGELSAATPAGRERRKNLHDAMKHTEHEFGGIGIEMNQWYKSSAIVDCEESKPRATPPEDPVLTYQITTYPGSRCPHAWLNKRIPETPISTIDLAGHQAFCLLTGIGGEAWKRAAAAAKDEFHISINAYSIGWQQDWEDSYGDWARRREVEEDGCILLRPDRTVCWRSLNMRHDAKYTLFKVLRNVLAM